MNVRLPKRASLVCIAALAWFGACRCEDDLLGAGPWEVEERLEPLPQPEPEPQEPEERVIVPVDALFAQTERSSLGIGDDGQVWVAFHTCRSARCDQVDLAVAKISAQTDQPIEIERIAPQREIFGLTMVGNTPWVVYLDEDNDRFSLATRAGEDDWRVQPVPVDYRGSFDGFDLDHHEGDVFISYAPEDGAGVDLLQYDSGGPDGAPRLIGELKTLELSDPGAALERGLVHGGDQDLYLVHRVDRRFAISRYDLDLGEWGPPSEYGLDDQTVSALAVRRDGALCTSQILSRLGLLQVSCGVPGELEAAVWDFDREIFVSSYSSLVEAPDGRLVVVFVGLGQSGLEALTIDPNSDQTERTPLVDDFASGVSAQVDPQGRLAVSYYTCASRQTECTLAFQRLPLR